MSLIMTSSTYTLSEHQCGVRPAVTKLLHHIPAVVVTEHGATSLCVDKTWLDIDQLDAGSSDLLSDHNLHH